MLEKLEWCLIETTSERQCRQGKQYNCSMMNTKNKLDSAEQNTTDGLGGTHGRGPETTGSLPTTHGWRGGAPPRVWRQRNSIMASWGLTSESRSTCGGGGGRGMATEMGCRWGERAQGDTTHDPGGGGGRGMSGSKALSQNSAGKQYPLLSLRKPHGKTQLWFVNIFLKHKKIPSAVKRRMEKELNSSKTDNKPKYCLGGCVCCEGANFCIFRPKKKQLNVFRKNSIVNESEL